MSKKHPGFYFYPGDWMKDPNLRICSIGARGLWLDMLCLMFESARRGYLQVCDAPMSLEQLARATGCSTDEVTAYLRELESSGVFSRTEHGTIYSRRLVRVDQVLNARAMSGSKGGSKTQANRKARVQANSNLSSSYSVSVSTTPSSPPPDLEAAVEAVIECGCSAAAARHAIDTALGRANPPPLSAILEIIKFWKLNRQWGPGALVNRIENATPRGDPTKGWPEALPSNGRSPSPRKLAEDRHYAAQRIISKGRKSGKSDDEITKELQEQGYSWNE